MIVTDPEGKDAYVVMDLDQYELFLGFSGDDEIEENFEEFPDHESEGLAGIPESKEEEVPDVWDVMHAANEETQTWDLDKLSEEELAELEKQYQAFTAKNVQEAIVQTETEKPVVEKQKDPDDFGEEEFYLEPIE